MFPCTAVCKVSTIISCWAHWQGVLVSPTYASHQISISCGFVQLCNPVQAVPWKPQQRHRMAILREIVIQQLSFLHQEQQRVLLSVQSSTDSETELQHLRSADVARQLSAIQAQKDLEMLCFKHAFWNMAVEPVEATLLSLYSWPYMPDALAVCDLVSNERMPRLSWSSSAVGNDLQVSHCPALVK
jgi:hypothetical protein